MATLNAVWAKAMTWMGNNPKRALLVPALLIGAGALLRGCI